LPALGPRELDAALDGFRAGRQQEDPLQRIRQHAGQLLDQLQSDLGGEAVGVVQPLFGHLPDRLHHLGVAVADGGDQDAGGEIEPPVAVGIQHGHVFTGLPDDRGLPGHAPGFQVVQALQLRDRLGHRDLRADLAERCLNMFDGLGDQGEFFGGHVRAVFFL